MRKLVILLLLVLPLPLQAQAPTHPAIALTETIWKFGDKEQGDSEERRFAIENRGTAALKISYARVTCGCLKAKVETETIAPGKKGSILVELDASKQHGAIKKQILIGSNDPKRPQVYIQVEGLIHPRVSFEPLVLDLGVVDPAKGEFIDKELTVLVREGIEIELENASVGMPATLELKIEAFGEKEERHGWRLRFKPMKGLPAGQRIMVPVQFRFKDMIIPRLTAAVAVEAMGLIEVSPRKPDFGKVELGSEARAELVISRRDGKPFLIQSFRCLDPQVTIEGISKEPLARHEILIKRPADRIGNIAGRIYIVTDIPEQRIVTMPLSGLIVRPDKDQGRGHRSHE